MRGCDWLRWDRPAAAAAADDNNNNNNNNKNTPINKMAAVSARNVRQEVEEAEVLGLDWNLSEYLVHLMQLGSSKGTPTKNNNGSNCQFQFV